VWTLKTQVLENSFWILNLIQIFGLYLSLDPNIWIWILKKSKFVFLKKWIWVENLIQLFGSKMDVDWIIKSPIHAHPYLEYRRDRFE